MNHVDLLCLLERELTHTERDLVVRTAQVWIHILVDVLVFRWIFLLQGELVAVCLVDHTTRHVGQHLAGGGAELCLMRQHGVWNRV